MKTIFSFFYCLLILIIVVWLVFKPNHQKVKETVVKTITVPGDSIPFPVFVKVPVPIDSIVNDTFWKAMPVDTAEILKRYFSRYSYADTIRDSTFVAILNEVISQNRIVDRKFQLQNLRSQAITYTTIQEPKPSLYVGPSLTYNGKMGLGVGGIWCNKNNAIGVNFDVTNRIVGVTYLLTLKTNNQ